MIWSGSATGSPRLILSTFFMPSLTWPQTVYWPLRKDASSKQMKNWLSALLGAVARAIEAVPLGDQVAAISCGLYRGEGILDLDYAEDSNVQADANFVLTGQGGIVEIQTTAEEEAFSRAQFDQLLSLAETGIGELVGLQRQVLGL